MSMSRLSFALVFVALLAASDRPLAADAWIEVRSPHFTVVSSAGEGTARQYAWQFEQVRAALNKGWPWAKTDLDRPALIILAKDVPTMRALAPQDWEGENQIHHSSWFGPGTDRYYFLMRSNLAASDVPEGVNPYRQSFWAYADIALASGLNARFPFWLQKGLAAVLSNTIVLRTEVQSGRPIPTYSREVARGHFPLERLFDITEDSPEYHNDVERGRFIAECWAVAQYIVYGTPGPEGAAKANTFAELILQGMHTPVAIANVFGSVAELDAAYQLQLAQGRFRYATWKIDASIRERDFATRPLRPAEAAAVRAAWYVTEERRAEARDAIAEARRIEPDLPSTFDVEGRLFELENNVPAARRAFTRAVGLGSDNFYGYFALARGAMMGAVRDAGEQSRLQGLLTQSIALNDHFAGTHSYLASLLLQMNQPTDAVAELRRAVTLDPRSVSHRILLARTLLRLSLRDEALREARAAMTVARTEQERRMIQSLIDEIGR